MNKLVKKATVGATAILLSFGPIATLGSNNTVQAASKIRVSYTLKNVNKKKIASKKLTLKKNTTVMAGLKKAWKVSENKGFVTQIHGHSQNQGKKIYWMYYVNGKMANVGANQYKLHNKDHVTWILEKSKF